MPNAVFLPLALGLLAVAIVRRGDRVAWVLAVGLLASLGLQVFDLSGTETFIGLFAIDLAAVVALCEPYTRQPNKPAWVVALLGWGKLSLTAWVCTLWDAKPLTNAEYNLYAWSLSLAYLAQVVVAGGFLDGPGRRLDNLVRWVAPRFHYSLWHVEG